jgi:hypothetical protein
MPSIRPLLKAARPRGTNGSEICWGRPVSRAAIALLFLVLMGSGAEAQKRIALVIGNSAYQHTGRLANPKNDATDIAAALKTFGFVVIEGFDLDKAAFDRKLHNFATALAGADAGVLFYAGHGLQVAGRNYLVPIDAKAELEALLHLEMVRADDIQRVMEASSKTNVLFLDACRDNPLARNLARTMGTRSSTVGTGLATIEAGYGTLISFSTHPGAVASDGAGRNSPYTNALMKYIAVAGDDLNTILINVRRDVRRDTQGKQVPWEHSSLEGRFYFGAPPTSAPATPTPPYAAAILAPDPLFTPKDRQEVETLARKHHLTLPPFNFEKSNRELADKYRKFIGVWVNEVGYKGKGRRNMIILTTANAAGRLRGFQLYGPPDETSFDQFPAGINFIDTTIEGNNFHFVTNADGSRFDVRLLDNNSMQYTFVNTKGQTTIRSFRPVWRLMDAERKAGR